MGHEYESSFTPPLDSFSLERLLADLQQPPTWPLLRTEQDGQTHVLHYAYAAGVPPAWEEDFLLYLSPQKLYVLLHTAPGEQAPAVLAWLQRCLPANGLATAAFEEL
jgi:hypothetical protein